MKRILSAALCLCLCLCLTACGAGGSGEQELPCAEGELFAMDTYMTVTCYGADCEEALEAARAEIERLDALLSVGSEDSEVSRANRDGETELSPETAEMVAESIRLCALTGGAFDITVYPLMDAWGFPSGDFRVPEEAELAQLLARIGSDRLTLEGSTLCLGAGQGIDLGGIAKGYTSQRIAELFDGYDLVCGIISLGGNVQCCGTRPDGALWRVGIRDPFDPDSGRVIGVLECSDCAVITSGAYERYFVDEETGRTYHHILDPRTGYPAHSGLVSVTVVSENGMLADALSTACYVLGLEDSIDLWRSCGAAEGFDLILVGEDGEIYLTGELGERFTAERDPIVVE